MIHTNITHKGNVQSEFVHILPFFMKTSFIFSTLLDFSHFYPQQP